MGYSHLLGVQALMNANNEINNAVIWIENFISNLNNTYPLYIVDVVSKKTTKIYCLYRNKLVFH